MFYRFFSIQKAKVNLLPKPISKSPEIEIIKLNWNSVYNTIGLGFPMIVGLFTMPYLVDGIGSARFGMLTLVWAFLSYFSLFDMGLGRVLTQEIALLLATKQNRTIGIVFVTVQIFILCIGVLGGILMFLFSSKWLEMMPKTPNESELLKSIYYVALGLPAVILTSGFRGTLEAMHEFRIVNVLRVPLGLYTFVAPSILVALGKIQLDLITFVLILGRVVGCILYGFLARNKLPLDLGPMRFDWVVLKRVVIAGGWMTVSNVISPIIGYLDRFVIGYLISAVAVSYYVVPQELITKIWIIPMSITSVLFPIIVERQVFDFQSAVGLTNRATRTIAIIVAPFLLIAACFSSEILSIWIGQDFAANGSFVFKIFCFGVFVNCLAHAPFTFLQSAGRTSLTAAIHFIEFILYIPLAWFSTNRFGFQGAAIAWLIRIVVDALLINYFFKKSSTTKALQ